MAILTPAHLADVEREARHRGRPISAEEACALIDQIHATEEIVRAAGALITAMADLGNALARAEPTET